MFPPASSWRLWCHWAWWLPGHVPSFPHGGWGSLHSAQGLQLFWCSQSDAVKQENLHLSQVTQVCCPGTNFNVHWVSKKGKTETQIPFFLLLGFGLTPILFLNFKGLSFIKVEFVYVKLHTDVHCRRSCRVFYCQCDPSGFHNYKLKPSLFI